MAQASSRRGVGAASVTLAAAGLLAAGIVVGAVALPQRPPAVAAAAGEDAGNRTLPVTKQSYDDPRQVATTVQDAPEKALTLRETSGTVTAIDCEPGGVIASGTSPVSIDDRATLALATPTPLWRDLGPGTKGDDVGALQVELHRLGYLTAEPDGTFGPATAAAVRDLQRDVLGHLRPSGTLVLAQTLWLPAEQVTVASCDLAPGSVLTTTAFATVGGALESLRLSVPTGAAPGPRVATLAGITTPVPDDGVVTDPEFLAAVEAALATAPAGSASPTVGYVLVEPLDVVVVPPGALFALSGAHGCIVADGAPHPVTVISSALGQAFVTFDDGATPTAVALTGQADGQACR